MNVRRVVFWVAALAAIAAVAGATYFSGSGEDIEFEATDVSDVTWGRDFHLTGDDGAPHELAEFRGKVVALYFGYTQCPDVCPTTMATLAQAVRMLGNDGERVQGVFITVDPRHDTPQVLAKYVTTFHSSFIGLYGDKPAIQHTAREFHVLASRAAHSTPVFLFDPTGRLRLIVRPEATPESIAHDLRLLLTKTPA